MRIGMGYDLHRLVEGRDRIIGGVKIETIQSFDRWSTATCQGHRGYIGWVWPNGVAQN